jgi:hypothetical protein
LIRRSGKIGVGINDCLKPFSGAFITASRHIQQSQLVLVGGSHYFLVLLSLEAQRNASIVAKKRPQTGTQDK